MKVGLIGLGKMGLNLGQNLLDHQHDVVAFDVNPNAVKNMIQYGATGVSSYKELIQSLESSKNCLGYGPACSG